MENANLPIGVTEIPVLAAETVMVEDAHVNDRTVIVSQQQLTKYSGSANQDVHDWVSETEMVCEANSWTTNPAIMRHIPTALEGTALKWYKQRVAAEGRFQTWEAFKEEIIKAFGAANESSSKFGRMIRREQAVGEDVLKYVYDKLELCTRYDEFMAPKTRVEQVLHGLQKEYHDYAHEREPQTVEAMIKLLKRKQAIEERKQRFANAADCHASDVREQRRTPHSQVRFTGACHECKKIGHYARDCYKRKIRLENERRERETGVSPAQAKNGNTGERRY